MPNKISSHSKSSKFTDDAISCVTERKNREQHLKSNEDISVSPQKLNSNRGKENLREKPYNAKCILIVGKSIKKTFPLKRNIG